MNIYLVYYLFGILVSLFENHVLIVVTQSHEYASVISTISKNLLSKCPGTRSFSLKSK